MTCNVEFFEASSMHHALLLVNDLFGDDGIILSYDQVKSGKGLVTAIKQLPGVDNICLQIFSKVIVLLKNNGFSKKFINQSYDLIVENIKKIPFDVESFLTIIFEKLVSVSKNKRKTFVFIGNYGVGKTTVVTKFIKNCIENSIDPDVYYLSSSHDIGVYTLIMHLQNFNLKPKVIGYSKLNFIDTDNINIIDSESISISNAGDAILELTKLDASIFYVVRSDQNIDLLKDEIDLLKKIGIDNFVINHSSGNDTLCKMISFIVDNGGKILYINSSRISEEDFSLNVAEKLTDIVMVKKQLLDTQGQSVSSFN